MSRPYTRPTRPDADAPVVAPPMPTGLSGGMTAEAAAEIAGDAFLAADEELELDDLPKTMPLVQRAVRDPVATEPDEYPARLVSALVDMLETAQPNSKFVNTGGRSGALATPDKGEIRGDRSDPLVRYLPGLTTLRKVRDGEFIGYLPLGAARDVREHFVPGKTARATFLAMVKLVHGE